MDLYSRIADERRLAADLLDSLTPAQLDTPTLCPAWTAHDMGAHLLMPLVTSTPTFALAMVRSRGSFNRASESLTAKVAARPTGEIASGLRANADHRFTPPGLGPEAPLTDLIIHGQDIRRPLGLTRTFPPGSLQIVLDFLTGPDSSRGFVPRARLAGLSFASDDLDWRRGSGPLVTGPAESIMMALAGREVALEDLSGPGAEILAARVRAE